MRRSYWALVAAALAGAGVACAAPPVMQLFVNGRSVPTDIRTINGRPYVPLADVARALNMTVVRRSGGYELTVAGGAGQVQGARQGKIGDELFTCKWRFQVLGVQEAPEYVERYYQQKRAIKPRTEDETLILVSCRIKNGVRTTQTPILTERIPGNTAIADDQGHSYAPIDYDAREETDKIGSYAAASMLPGAQADFVLVFSVPRGTRPRALVFTLLNYPDNANGQGTDVRVQLAP